MTIGLVIVLLAILCTPFLVKRVEHNLEIFLFVMGFIAVTITGSLSIDLFKDIFQNEMLYFITAAVLTAGIIFRFTVEKIRTAVDRLAHSVHMPLFLFLVIAALGLFSSIITAIVASLVLVEIAQALPVSRKYKVRFCIVSCFAIGLGAALTPIGEPLATIVTSLLDQDFFYLFKTLAAYILPGILAIALFGAVYAGKNARIISRDQMKREALQHNCSIGAETFPTIISRALKIFLFIVALELLGAGFKPLINTYVIQLDSTLLYWINIISAVLDNATLAAAEMSPRMSQGQITSILMGLLISGGMLIPGNIPNIISACKLNIGSRDWAKLGVPMGLTIMGIYFFILIQTSL